MSSDSLPSFERPPVVETVLGVQFQPLTRFQTAHFGVLWKSLGPDWTEVSDAPPLAPQMEQFGDAADWGAAGFGLSFSTDVRVRMQIRNADHSKMIQVQNDRFHYNWLGSAGGDYPRYRYIRPEFQARFDDFERFVAAESLGTVDLNQWEVTYVNHIPKGSVWNDPRDWARLFGPVELSSSTVASAELESLEGEWHYEIPPRRGRLHIRIRHARARDSGGNELLVLTLTARGPMKLATGEAVTLDEGLNLGHETIVRAFRDVTSDVAHDHWGLIHEHA